ncbi:hypothetical protein PLICRDRAFT_175664 [Plicaturopsis crispa FD-325 SS-3]|nr:hypothetical protein PLICRDRAFT_175664 [Plicaturopsis crispa FD-325 SS-3]
MGDDLWQKEQEDGLPDQLRLRRQITADDWVRPILLAAYIMEIRASGHVYRVDDDSRRRAITSAAPHLPLLRNLRYLELTGLAVPLGRLYLSRSIVSLKLGHFDKERSATRFVNALSSTPSPVPRLSQLVINDFWVDASLIRRFKETWPTLRALICGVLTAEAFLELSTLSHLQHLEFQWPEEPVDLIGHAYPVPCSFAKFMFSDFSEAFPAPRFPALRSLEITRLEAIRHLMPLFAVCFPLLEEINITAQGTQGFRVSSLADDLLHFFEAVRERCAQDVLSHITLSFGGPGCRPMPLDRPRDAVVCATLPATLLPFHALTCFNCDTPTGFDLDDFDILMIAEAWPSLEHLHLSSTYGWLKPSGITFHGLTALLSLCPRLSYLGIVMSSHWQSFPPYCAEPQPNSMITTLNLGNSPIECGSEVVLAACLAGIMPSLTRISAWTEDTCSLVGPALDMSVECMGSYARLWGDVERLLRIFSDIRTEETSRTAQLFRHR